jgi:two-component system LytT family response regulator
MKQFSVLIVDDEPLAREGLRILLTGDPQVAAISEAKNSREAVIAIREGRPDLVFLDVQMPEMDGFGVVEEVGPERMPAVVFVTAHDQYAIRAFEINALDYLLKPVTAERFHQSLERAKARLSGGEETGRRIVSLLEAMANPSPYAKRLAVRSGARTLFVPVDDIEWIQAAENYVEVHHLKLNQAAGCYLLQATMNTKETSLHPEMFLRIHRSLIVNVGRIKELMPAGHGEYVVVLRSGVRLQSGRSYHDKLKALASNPFGPVTCYS